MKRVVASFTCGIVFGVGLIVAQMTNPAKVIGFLDVTGAWDPSLALVMAGAVAVFSIAYRLGIRRSAPVLGAQFVIPQKTRVDRKLMIGSLVFGAGWGLGGFCPGPALVSSGFGDPRVWAFVGAMVAGMISHAALRKR